MRVYGENNCSQRREGGFPGCVCMRKIIARKDAETQRQVSWMRVYEENNRSQRRKGRLPGYVCMRKIIARKDAKAGFLDACACEK
jgi:hypothetical protein